MRGPIVTQEDFDRRVDFIRDWLIARKGELACLAPLGALLVAGCQDGSISSVVVALCLVGELFIVLMMNPYGFLNGCLPPMSRTLFLMAIVLAALGATMGVMDAPLVGLLLVVLGAGCVAIGTWRRKPWLLDWQTQQSPEVDQVLAHLSHGGEFAPASAWEQDGCRQTRALLHQALHMECNEDELGRAYKAVYQLGYLCGMEMQEDKVESLQRKLQAAESKSEEWKSQAISWKSWAKYYEGAGNSVAHLEERLHQAEERAQNAEQRAEDAEAELAAWRPAQATESREDAVRAFVAEGHSYREAAEVYGLSKSKVALLVKEAG
ncbi:MAG: hypothetical protein LUE89_09470 [Clostridiales bacterium]|nr:hypothetical protein [Clostridiales bacterium]